MKYIIQSAVILIFLACSGEKSVDIPKGVIQPEKMSAILLDVQLMQSHLAQESLVDPYILDSTSAFYNAVYKNHSITKTHFDSSLMFYSENISILDSIYNKVFADLKEMELELKDIKYNAPNIKYLSREDLINTLRKLSINEFLIEDSVDFVAARDSLNNYIRFNKSELEKLKISPSQLKNSFAIYSNSIKRMKQLKEDLKSI